MALNQTDVVDRLTFQGRKLMRDRVERPMADTIVDGWNAAKKDIADFARGVWKSEGGDRDVFGARRAKERIEAYMERRVREFRGQARTVLHQTMRQSYRMQYLTSCWILDQVTPPNYRVRPRRNVDHYKVTGTVQRGIGKKSEEAMVLVSPEASRLVESWFDEPSDAPANRTEDGEATPSPLGRMDSYLKAWGGTALVGLGMAATYNSDPDEVGGKIENTSAGGQNMDYALSRLVKTQVEVSVMDADDDVTADWGDLEEERFWGTMEDERVCDICASQEDLPEAEWEYHLPAHPGCRCYPKRKPKSFKALAGDMGVPGADDRDMVFRDPDTGKPVGVVLVSFDNWMQKL